MRTTNSIVHRHLPADLVTLQMWKEWGVGPGNACPVEEWAEDGTVATLSVQLDEEPILGIVLYGEEAFHKAQWWVEPGDKAQIVGKTNIYIALWRGDAEWPTRRTRLIRALSIADAKSRVAGAWGIPTDSPHFSVRRAPTTPVEAPAPALTEDDLAGIPEA